MLRLSEDEEEKKSLKKTSWWCFFFYITDYGRMGTELLLNYWIHGDKVEIGPNCLSHDYLCPMTIWGLIKRSHCLPDWSKNSEEERLAQLGDDCFYLHLCPLSLSSSRTLQSSPLSHKICFLRMADAHYYREGAQPRVRADSCTPLSRIVWGCQSRTPPPLTHIDTQTHTFHASSYSYRQEPDFRDETHTHTKNWYWDFWTETAPNNPACVCWLRLLGVCSSQGA